MDWPYPDPGLGMVHDDGDPVIEQPRTRIPGPDATWAEIVHYAQRFDGYRTHGDRLPDIANAMLERFEADDTIDPARSLEDLHACLSVEARRYHQLGHEPGYHGARYVRALVATIEALTAADEAGSP